MTDHTIVLHDHDKSRADLVAEAIALCEERDRGLRARLKDETIEAFIRDLKIQIAQNSAHLAEFGKHKNWSERNLCATCHSTYPCNFITTKAKRLLGRE